RLDVRNEGAVDRAGTAPKRVLECVVRPPGSVVLLKDDVPQDALDIDDADPLPHPLLAHETRGCGPDLEVVRKHEDACDAGAERRVDPIFESLGVALFPLRGDQSRQAGEYVLFGQMPDVVLERIRNVAV